jgi:hypothetical protein
MPTPSEREFLIYRRGEVREIILREHREGLRFLPNPDTGLPFTEDEIRRATARGGRFYREADGIDLVGLGHQKRDEFFAQQVRIDRAGSGFLRTYHATLWGETYLPAFGGAGKVAGKGNPGTIWQGSTTVPDPFAVFGTDPAGQRYQVVINATADAVSGEAELVLIAIDGGDETNIPAGTIIKWANPPPGSAPDAVVLDDFGGGLDAETDADFAKRLSGRVRHKPASGNWSHFRTFAREASVSVEDAFVYPCAFYSGSVLVAVTQKRGATPGPRARVAGFNVLSSVTGMLVPPGSPVIPGRAHVVVVTVQPEPTDLVVRLAQPLGSGAGWTDLVPFPQVDGTDAVAITALTDETHFEITTGTAGQLPQGLTVAGGVHLMVWDPETSLFAPLFTATVTDLGAGVYAVEPASATLGKALAMGDWVSPDMSRRADITTGVNAYFDSLGPGEVIDLLTDERSVRCYRNPVASEAFPMRAGQSVLTFLGEALGAPVSDSTLASITLSLPSLPADPVDGPKLLVAGLFGVYPL